METMSRIGALALFSLLVGDAAAQSCPARLAPGSVIPDPPMVQSKNGVIGGTFTAYFDGDPTISRSGRYCLMYTGDGAEPPVEAPVLRLAPGERVNLGLVNRMPITPVSDVHAWNAALTAGGGGLPCSAQAVMSDYSTNLHFHGTNVKPECGSDETVTTLVLPGDPTWQYSFALPLNSPPGLDWYHPHVHGITQEQMLGGMTGAIVIESPNQMPNVVAGLRERILILRDQDPAPPPPGVRYVDRPDVIDNLALPAAQRSIFDAQGLPASTALLRSLLAGGTVVTSDPAAPGSAPQPSVVPPWKDLSVNKVEVKFAPSASGVSGYTAPGTIRMEAASEFWRVANVSADSYIKLQVRFMVAGSAIAQTLRVVSMDGVPISAPNGQMLFDDNTTAPVGKVSTKPNKTIRATQLLLPPGGRVEFIAPAPAAGQVAELVSLLYETNADSNPMRVLARLEGPAAGAVPDPNRVMPAPTASALRTRFVDLGSSKPKATPDHLLYFSQNDSAFFITEDVTTSKTASPPLETAFSMRAGPSIYVPTGATQEWKIENRALEAHAFHMHQIRFRVLKRYPSATSPADQLDEFTLRDTVDLPAYSGTGTPPSVTVRIYFNEPDIRGNFMYHCHILEHEDKGMMGIVRVLDPSAMPLVARLKSSPKVMAGASRGVKAAALPDKVVSARLVNVSALPADTAIAASAADAPSVIVDRFGRKVEMPVCRPSNAMKPERRRLSL